MAKHRDEEEEKDVAEVSDDVLEGILDEDSEEDDPLMAEGDSSDDKGWE